MIGLDALGAVMRWNVIGMDQLVNLIHRCKAVIRKKRVGEGSELKNM